MIVALEGHSYSGKTTLLNYLRDNLHIHPIAEHDVYAGGIDKYPPFPAAKEQMAKDSVDFFARLEAKRQKDAMKSGQRTVFYDRSFVSIILFQKYIRYLATPGEYNAYDYAKSLFTDLLSNDRVALPDYLVYVHCDSIATYLRRQEREISVGLLRGEDALKFFEHEYGRVCTLYGKFDRILELKSADDRASLARNTRLLDAAIDGASELDKTAHGVIAKRLMEIL